MSVPNDSTDLDVRPGVGWQQIDVALQSIAKRRGALDAIEARWLREALRVKIWREVGCVSMADYVERRLGYAPRTALDRVRVAMALEQLPKLEAALSKGLPHSAVREVTRVATKENEQTWLDAIRGKNVHEIEGMVTGRPRGANPGDPPNPNLTGKTLPFEAVRPATEALVRDARRKMQAEREPGDVISDDELLATLARLFLDGGASERTTAPYQVAVTVCERCNRGWQESGGRKFELARGDVERACCDAQHIGSLDTTDPERAWQDVPPSVRRFVYRRDGGRCRMPGCRSTRCLEIHHLRARADGGMHDAENLILLCDGCHAALHRGAIAVTGTATALEATRRHRIEYALDGEISDDEETEHGSALDVTNPSTTIEASDNMGTNIPHLGSPESSEVNILDQPFLVVRVTRVDSHGRLSDVTDSSTDIESCAHVGTNTAHGDAGEASASCVARPRPAAPSEAGTRAPAPPSPAPDPRPDRREHRRLDHEQRRVDARRALVGLGYRAPAAGKAVDLALGRVPDGTLEELIRESLRSLVPK